MRSLPEKVPPGPGLLNSSFARELGERAKLTLTTVLGLGSGRIPRPHFGTIRKLTTALGVSPEQLLSTEETFEERKGASWSLTLGWTKMAEEEEFEREVEGASLETLNALQRELEELKEEQGRLQRLYGKVRGVNGSGR